MSTPGRLGGPPDPYLRCAATMRTLPDSPVFTRADALTHGWSGSALSRAARSGRVAALRRNQFSAPENRGDPRHAAIAAVRECGGSVISHRSAALLHNLPLLSGAPTRPDLTVMPGATGDVAGALLHRARLRPDDVVRIDDVPVTSVARTLVDLARCLPMPAAVVSMDAALHKGMTDRGALADVRAACRRWPGIRRLEPVLDVADARAESPLETISRLVLRNLNLPTPQLQPTVYDLDGRFLGRLDFYWDEFGVAGEADGLAKYDERDALAREKLRQEDLENAGLVVARWGWTDARSRPGVLRRRLESAFERGQRRDLSGFDRHWTVRPA